MPASSRGQKLGDIFVDMNLRLDRIEKDLKKFTNDAEKRGRDAGKAIERGTLSGVRDLGKKVAAAMGVALAAILALKEAFDFAVQAKNARRDADEIQSKFDVVFGQMADEANKWAEEFGGAVGRANQDVKNWLATLQDTFVPLGFARDRAAELSRELVRLAVDVASFNNAADQETIDLFTSALVGNHEAVRRFGIIITEATLKQEALNQGIDKNFQSLSDLEKVQLRYSIIMRATSDAQGDAIRTAESLANVEKRRDAVLKNLLESAGGRLIPFFQALTRAQISAFESLRELVKSTEEAVKDYQALNKTVSNQENEIRSLVTRYNDLSQNQNRSADEQSELNRVIQRLAFLVPSAVTAVNDYGDALGISTSQIDKFLNKQRALLRATKADVFKQLKSDLEFALRGFVAGQKGVESFRAELEKVQREGGRTVVTYENLGATSVRMNREQQDAATATEQIEKSIAGAATQAAEYSDRMQSLIPLLENFVDIEKSTPESLSNELGISAEQAAVLHANLQKVIKDVNLLEGGSNQGKGKIRPGPRPARPNVPVEEAPLFSFEESVAELDAFEAAERKFFDELKFLAKDYLDFRLVQIELEADALERAGLTAVQAQEFRVAQLKALEEEYTEFLKNSTVDRMAAMQEQFVGTFDTFGTLFDSTVAGLNASLDGFRFKLDEAGQASEFKRGITAMANHFIGEVQRMIVKWLAFKTLTTAANFLGIPIPGFASGGTVQRFGNTPFKGASGLDFRVPAGFNADSFPLLVRSGERVRVDSATQTANSDEMLRRIASQIGALNLNIIDQGDRINQVEVMVGGEIDGDVIKLMNDRATSAENALR